ncbi:uncharacterized protein VTP21DRAFT_7482 [Calcarisporiella thermophila]|uniref:uncharacterized protein n=1 Tax=Calcarisporiella thermophila TaxID=911321 RepID=UPI003743AE92
MTSHPQHPEQKALLQFEHQVGGHQRMLAHPENSGIIIKPVTNREHNFYEESALHPDFKAWMPEFYGCLVPQSGDAQSNGLPLDADNGLKSGEVYICMENLVAGFKKPCLMDLKIGTRLYDDDASEEKKARMQQQALKTTTGSLGIRITGFQVWNESTKSYYTFERELGRSLTADGVPDALARFFSADGLTQDQRAMLIERFMDELYAFEEMLREQEVRLYASSLLFIYEGDPVAMAEALTKEEEDIKKKEEREKKEEEEEENMEEEEEEEDERKVFELRIVDFAHSHWETGIGPDDGAVLGVQNTIKFLGALQKK